MKKHTVVLMGMILMTMSLVVGCGQNKGKDNETTTQQVETQESTSSGTALDNTTTTGNQEESTREQISEEEAKKIAISDAGVKESDITNIRIDLDREGTELEYDIDFYVGNQEYEYTVSAKNGSILEKDMDIDDDF